MQTRSIKVFWLIVGVIYTVLSISSALKGGDFDVFLDAAEKLSAGTNIYAPPFVKGLQYFYSPLFALILIPFTFSYFTIELIWLLISGILFYRIWRLLCKYIDTTIFNNKELFWFTFLCFFFSLRFLLYNISMIQVSVFLLWAALESVRLIKNGNQIKGSILLAFAINVKLLPAVILPYLLYRGYFKAFRLTIGAIVLFLLLPGLFIGFDFNFFLLSEWWQVINPGNSEHMIEAEVTAQSLVGVIPVFITDTPLIFPYRRNFIDLSTESVALVTNLVRLFIVGITLFFLKKPFKRNVDRLYELRGIGYILLAVPLIFPHQQKYAFIFLFPMMVYLIYYCFVRWKNSRTRSFKVYFTLLVLVSLIFTPVVGSDVLGKHLYDLLHYFRILGLGTITLIVFALIASPAKIAASTSK